MAGVLTYSSNAVTVVVGGKIITGRTNGTFVSIKRNAQAYTLAMGVDGVGSRSKTNDKSGTYELTLHHTAPDNAILQAFATADDLTNSGAVPVIVRDNNGSTLATSVTAWVQKLPDVEYSGEVGERTWVLESDAIELSVSGNGVV